MRPKTGGRLKGTPNKATLVVADVISASGVNLPEEAMKLYSSTNDLEVKLKILSLLFPYVYPKRVDAKPDESIDITPENEESVIKESIAYIEEKYPHLLPKPK